MADCCPGWERAARIRQAHGGRRPTSRRSWRKQRQHRKVRSALLTAGSAGASPGHLWMSVVGPYVSGALRKTGSAFPRGDACQGRARNGCPGRHQRSVLEQPRRRGCRMETGSSNRERWRSTAPNANEPSYLSAVTQVRDVASVSEKIGWGALAP